MSKQVKLTDKEFKVLKAIDASEYGEYLVDAIWSFSVTRHADLPKRTVPGVCASLSKKGLVRCGNVGGEMDTIEMTEAGIEAFLKRNGGTSRKATRYVAA